MCIRDRRSEGAAQLVEAIRQYSFLAYTLRGQPSDGPTANARRIMVAIRASRLPAEIDPDQALRQSNMWSAASECT
eukprot:14857019-Alexandrium_andersonii.AAC.1